MTTTTDKSAEPEQLQSHRLNLYLFLDSIDTFEACLKQPGESRKHTDITNEKTIGDVTYKVFLIEGEEKHPKWYNLVKDYILDEEIESLKFQSKGIIVLLATNIDGKMRYFALTGGFSYFAIDKEKIEPNFGLYTSLNSVKPNEIKLFDARHIEFQSIQKRIASNIASHIGELGFEYEADILRIVSGTCADEGFGTSVSGSDCLHLTSKVSLDQIAKKLSQIYTVYKSDKYKTNFKELDYIQPERNPAIIAKLNQQLVDTINNRATDLKLSMAYPDQIDYSRCDYFKINLRDIPRPQKIISNVNIPNIYRLLDLSKTKSKVTIDDLKSLKIVGFSEEHTPLTGSDSIFSYLVFETDETNQKRYVLSNRNWYCINSDYIKEVDSDLLRRIPSFSSIPALLAWTKGKNSKGQDSYDEGKYNEQYKTDPAYLYLDKQWFQNFGKGNRASRNEIADLFHFDTKKLICVKKGREAASLSALWSQGTVSADLFVGLPAYRDEFIRRVRGRWPAHATKITSALIKELTFVFAIGTESVYANIISLLPVFSRINLLRHARSLEKMNFKVEVATIQQL